MLFLIRSEILELLDNTLTANYEYSRINRENLPLTIQIFLSKKPETSCDILSPFLESTLNVQCSEKEMSLIGQVFVKIFTPRDALI